MQNVACEVSTLLQHPCTCHPSGGHQGGSHVALVWGWKSTPLPLNFICEVIWHLLHTFSTLRQSMESLCPLPLPLFYGLAKAMWGWGRMVCCVCCACLCMCKCGCATLFCVKNGLRRAEYCFTVLICRGISSSVQIQCPELTMYVL